MPFGYIVSDETVPEVQLQVEKLCIDMLDHVFIAKAPTDAPVATEPPVAVATPTVDQNIIAQTTAPTAMPTSKPTAGATQDLDTTTSGGDNSNPTVKSVPETEDDSFSRGPMVGIAAAAFGCLLLILYAVHRRRERSMTEKNVKNISCDNTSSDSDPEAPSTYPGNLVLKRNDSFSAFDVTDGVPNVSLAMPSDASTASNGDFGQGFSFNKISMRNIEEAVDNGDWDKVYQLASRLAEQEDMSTLSSYGRQSASGRLSSERMERRSRLKEEDHERVKTLDELIDSRDWTGVAVTAALYAGESGYKKQEQFPKSSFFSRVTGQRVSNAARAASSQDDLSAPVRQGSLLALGAPTMIDTGSDTDVEAPTERRTSRSTYSEPPLLQLKYSMDHAVDAGDWDQVVRISSAIEKNGTFQSRHTSAPTPSPSGGTLAFQTLIEEMDRAMSRGDWALVAFYADKIRELKSGNGDEATADSTSSLALVPFSAPPSSAFRSHQTEDAIMSRKQTLEKLVQAQKWKGVSIMAGLYAMEEKGSLQSDFELS